MTARTPATARPWRLDTIDPSVIRSVDLADKMTHLASCEYPADATLIVTAVNAHDDLVAALTAIVEHADRGAVVDTIPQIVGVPAPLIDTARALLARLADAGEEGL